MTIELVRIDAPFTEEQIAKLLEWQESPFVHSYTCRFRGDSPHTEHFGDYGGLRPTTEGLLCDDCGHLQTWAHDPSQFTIPKSLDELFGRSSST